jgi:multidrug efflux pump subunit AcrB
MILLFLGSWRSTVIIALSIPLSVMSSIVILSALGETINLMTLGGLALAVGILVDDATVEIENVHRQMSLGKPLEESILDGAQEIALPAFVSTLCMCIVFVPMFFLSGVARYLFVPLAEAVVFAMLASYVLSRTLIPTLVMWFYRKVHQPGLGAHGGHHEDPHSLSTGGTLIRRRESENLSSRIIRPLVQFQLSFERGFHRFREGYLGWLEAFMDQRKAFAALFLFGCVGSLGLVFLLGEDFFPVVDAGQLRLHLRARTGTRIEETARLVDEVEQSIRRQIPADELDGVLDNIGIPGSGISLSYSNNGLIGTGDAIPPAISPRATHSSSA